LRWVFYLSLFGIFHSYFGYPLSLWILARFRRRKVDKRPMAPSVSIIVAAHDEEKKIEQKIQNLLEIDYPDDKMEVIIVSDGSVDLTNAIVAGYQDRGVKLLALPDQRGKEYAQLMAVQIARGEIFVFTDVAAHFKPDGIREIVANFADPSVGCVSSQDLVICAEGASSGESLYVRYEMWLRRLESRVQSLVGLSGSFFAARNSLCQDFNSEMDSDFKTVLNAIKAGKRAVIDSQAVCYYSDLSDPRKEGIRKERTVLRGMIVFFRHLSLLNPLKHGFFSYEYACHKLLRWCVPFFSVSVLVSNAVLSLRSIDFMVILGLQIAFYGAGILHFFNLSSLNHLPFRISSYFITANLSIVMAWLRFLRGERIIKWNPSER
jgi:glycosyltransferase involved in cell wall biosynthesis